MDESAFIKALQANPTDIVLRLIYADWLEGHGDPEAEFLRLMVEFQTAEGEKRRNIGEQIEVHAQRPRIGSIIYVDDILHWALTVRKFLDGAVQEKLAVYGTLVEVHIAGTISGKDIEELATSPCLSSLTNLYMWNNAISDDGGTALANSPYLCNLTRLGIEYNEIGDAGATALANSPYLSRLTALELDSNEIGNVGAVAIATSPHLSKLATLNLNFNNIGDAGGIALANSSHLPGLKTLSLEYNDITDDGFFQIRQSAASIGGNLKILYKRHENPEPAQKEKSGNAGWVARHSRLKNSEPPSRGLFPEL